MRTSKSSVLVLFISAVILAVHVAVSTSSAVNFNGGHELGFLPVKSECSGSIDECMTVGDEALDLEFQMDTGSNRRILEAKKYISYDTLRMETVQCSQRGVSYSNCGTGAQANLYSRGCFASNHCRQ
ncbi:hypothetical protein LWI28_014617 [Acer negundo]|uniref:Uncharacterized protein n=1 Tax=Acer negundo TaxID=4023 RepID=A0AAD5JKT2_ACENE|nr:hypothetical protein LWI28_014617 [Acer negundo]